jgi:hypothetical protein
MMTRPQSVELPADLDRKEPSEGARNAPRPSTAARSANLEENELSPQNPVCVRALTLAVRAKVALLTELRGSVVYADNNPATKHRNRSP